MFNCHDSVCMVNREEWYSLSYEITPDTPTTIGQGAKRVWVNDILAVEIIGGYQKWLHPDGTYHESFNNEHQPVFKDENNYLKTVFWITYWNGGGLPDSNGVLRNEFNGEPAIYPNQDQYMNIARHCQTITTPPARDAFGNPYLRRSDILNGVELA